MSKILLEKLISECIILIITNTIVVLVLKDF